MDVREEVEHGTTLFGFRYDTLEGHIEQGFEWFLLTKDHATGGIHFRIEAHWRLGDFPNWWSRLGFLLIGEHYRRLWRHRAPGAAPPARPPARRPRPIAAPGRAGPPRRRVARGREPTPRAGGRALGNRRPPRPPDRAGSIRAVKLDDLVVHAEHQDRRRPSGRRTVASAFRPCR